MSENISLVEPFLELPDGPPVERSDLSEQAILNTEEDLPYHLRRRLEILRHLKRCEQSEQYVYEQERAIQELNITPRTLRRYIRQFREQGLEGLLRQARSDQGQIKISEDWQKFILETYRKGNRGTRSMNRSQVVELVKSRAADLGQSDYPRRRTIYRLLKPELEARSQKQKRRNIGWQGEALEIVTRAGIELKIEYSNQVWQCDHTPVDILVVDKHGDVLGRPTLTTVIDTYSRCIVGINLGLKYPSAAVTCLALRHAILPKQYSPVYELKNLWGTYGLPQYLYTDLGSDFTSHHVDQSLASLGITPCFRRKPAEGGIVERPFGTINSEFLFSFPGYTTPRLKGHRSEVEAEACLTLYQLERLLVRYIVDNYNQLPDPRTVTQSRLARWESGRIAQPPLIAERELDILLMRQDRRRVYRGGYIKFSNLVYRGEYLAGYAGEQVVLRYDPSDITNLLIFRQQGAKDVFLTRARAQNLEAERLSLAEAKAISRRLRQAAKHITNRSVLDEVRDRARFVDELMQNKATITPDEPTHSNFSPDPIDSEDELDEPIALESLPDIQVYDLDELA